MKYGLFFNIWTLLSNWFPYNTQCSSQKVPSSIPITLNPQPSSTLSFFSVFKSLLCFGSLPLSPLFFFPSPPPWVSVKFLRIHIRVKPHGICLSLYGLFHLASHSQFHSRGYKGPYFILSHCHVVLHCVYKPQFLYPFISTV